MLARHLAAAGSADEALDAAIAFCTRRFDVPAAAWVSGDDGEPMRLAGVWGMGPSGRRELARDIPELPADDDRLDEYVSRFEAVSGASHARPIRAGGVLLFIGDLPSAYRPVLDAVASMLAETLRNLEEAEHREQDLDMGLAMTAHELRGPLLGARAALAQLLRREADREDDRGLLRRTERELAMLSEKVEGLLRWAAGNETIRCVRADLARITREAVASCTFEHGHDRVEVKTPKRLDVQADPRHLRTAIENVVRNALAYSPGDSKVTVRVSSVCGDPMVCVRDRGQGIAKEDRPLVFDPFARGRDGRSVSGNGLGLFIAKRVVEAHGGEISFSTREGRGTEFRMRLPGVVG